MRAGGVRSGPHAGRRQGYFGRVFNEQRGSLWSLVRAVVLLSGFAFTKVLRASGLFRFRAARRCYAAIYFLGKRLTDADKTRVIDTWLPPGGTIVDVGANFGFFAAYASRRVGPRGSVLCFEPDPDCLIFLRDLKSSDRGFANIEIHEQGLWTNQATLPLYTCDENPGENSLFRSPVHGIEVTISLVALDDVLPVGTTPDLIKMDIQGAEWHALQGMKRTLGRMTSGALIVECSPTDLGLAGKNIADLLDTLRETGFRVFRLTGAAPRPVQSAADLADLERRPLAQCDLLCTKPSAE
jgi:FkbM family methyltransferase